MKTILLIGLGNPGEKYAHNRHNVGFMYADFFAGKIDGENSDNLNVRTNFEQNKQFRAQIFEKKVEQNKYIIAKPQTFMNLSGESVRKIMQFYKIHPQDIFVAHDDLDISLGKFKIQKGSGPKMHNGLSSIEDCIGTKDFWRIRIGVDNRDPENRMPGEAYVLADFRDNEKDTLAITFQDIYNLSNL